MFNSVRKMGLGICVSVVAISIYTSVTWGAEVFVPDNRVPVSVFQTTPQSQTELGFFVRKEILDFVISSNGNLWIASCPTLNSNGFCLEKITFTNPQQILQERNQVLSSLLPAGIHVVVTDALRNQFPIVTHWNQSLNDGRGGQQVRGTDRLGKIGYVPETDAVQTASSVFSTEKTSPWNYNTVNYGLFSSDQTAPNAQVPGLERYVGEDYSIFSIDEKVSSLVSNKILGETGFPVVHLNGGAGSWDKIAQEGIPAFQVIHAQIVAKHLDKGSLATIILPPGWVANPVKKYPVLFYGYYDIHETFIRYGVGSMKMMGSLHEKKLGDVITVLWNGGGSFGPVALHPSAYDNASLIFDHAKEALGADTDQVVTVGCSRGGATTMAVAANPYHNNYKVKYALAYSPSAYKIGERTTVFRSMTYPGVLSVLGNFLGYRFSWQTGWLNPEGWTSDQISLQNYVGNSDPETADQEFSHGSIRHLEALRTKGTEIVLHVGTHDSYASFYQSPRFVSKATAYGIPVQFNIAYRFGHCGIKNLTESPEPYLRKVLTGDDTFKPEMVHVRRVDEGVNWKKPEVFKPDYQPVLSEMPRLVVRNGRFLVVISGGVSTSYTLKIWKIDSEKWVQQQTIEKVGDPVENFSGMLPSDEYGSLLHGIGSAKHDQIWPKTRDLGHYTYELSYLLPTFRERKVSTLSPVPGSKVNGFPVFEVVAEEPSGDFMDILPKVAVENRGAGISSH